MRKLQPLMVVFVLLLMIQVADSTHAYDGKRSVLKPLDVFEIEFTSEPQISPNGRHIIYTRNSMSIMKDQRYSHLWIISSDGSKHRPITSGSGSEKFPRWSPDGKRIAYVAKETAKGPSQIFCHWIDSGRTARLTQLTNSPDHLQWSPDGRSIAFTMLVSKPVEPFIKMPSKPEGAEWADQPRVIRRVRYRQDGQGYLKNGYRHVHLVPAEGGTPRQLTSGNYHHDGPLCWSPNGAAILFSANRTDDWEHKPRESEVYSVAVKDRTLRRLTNRIGPDHSPVVSPDGQRIAWLGFDDRKLSHQVTDLYVMDVDGRNRRAIPSGLDRSIVTPTWKADSSGLYFQYDDKGATKVGFVSLSGKVETIVSHVGGVTIGRPYSSGSFSVTSPGTIAFTRSLPEFPADVTIGKHGSAKIHTLTNLNGDLFGQRQLATTQEFWFKSSVDERRIQSWIVKPPGFDPAKKYPLILEIHGGPFANYGNRFSMEIQFYAAAGYVVLYVNPRGSTSYGQEFANLIHHAYPGHDYDDLMSGVDAVIDEGYIDPDNLFVTGGSGGGVLTAWIVGKTSRFRAAVSAKPVINWYSFALTSDIYPFFNGYWFPGSPWKHAQHYMRRSPISLVGNVTTPTMLITGEDDHRTPMSESEQFYQALKLRKIDTLLVRVPGASHAIVQRPSRLFVKVQHILKWFEIHKKSRTELSGASD